MPGCSLCSRLGCHCLPFLLLDKAREDATENNHVFGLILSVPIQFNIRGVPPSKKGFLFSVHISFLLKISDPHNISMFCVFAFLCMKQLQHCNADTVDNNIIWVQYVGSLRFLWRLFWSLVSNSDLKLNGLNLVRTMKNLSSGCRRWVSCSQCWLWRLALLDNFGWWAPALCPSPLLSPNHLRGFSRCPWGGVRIWGDSSFSPLGALGSSPSPWVLTQVVMVNFVCQLN